MLVCDCHLQWLVGFLNSTTTTVMGANCGGVPVTDPSINFTTCQGLWVRGRRGRGRRERRRREVKRGGREADVHVHQFVEMTSMSLHVFLQR